MRVCIVTQPGADTAMAWMEDDHGSGAGLAVSPARKMPAGFAAAAQEDRDAALRVAAEDFAAAYGFRVTGEFTPAEPTAAGAGWQAPIEPAPAPEPI